MENAELVFLFEWASNFSKSSVEQEFEAAASAGREYAQGPSKPPGQVKTESATPACGQPAVPRRLDDVLKHHELIKLKFDFKDQKKELAPQLAEKSGSPLITRVRNVAVLFCPKPAEPHSRGSGPGRVGGARNGEGIYRRGTGVCSRTRVLPRGRNPRSHESGPFSDFKLRSPHECANLLGRSTPAPFCYRKTRRMRHARFSESYHPRLVKNS